MTQRTVLNPITDQQTLVPGPSSPAPVLDQCVESAPVFDQNVESAPVLARVSDSVTVPGSSIYICLTDLAYIHVLKKADNIMFPF